MVWLVLLVIAVIILVCVKSKYSNNATEKVTDDKSDIIQLYTKTDGFYTYLNTQLNCYFITVIVYMVKLIIIKKVRLVEAVLLLGKMGYVI